MQKNLTAMKLGIWVLFLTLFLVTGCSIYKYAPREGDRPVLLGGKIIYNRSGAPFEKAKQESIIWTVGEAEKTLKECAPRGEKFVKKLPAYPIIILPEKDFYIFGANIAGFADLTQVFVRIDRFFPKTLAHEWLHIYLYYSGRRFIGDPLHNDPLWVLCGLRTD